MTTPEMCEKLWAEFCNAFPDICSRHDLLARFAYLAGYRACMDQCLPDPHMNVIKAAFEDLMFKNIVALRERKQKKQTGGSAGTYFQWN